MISLKEKSLLDIEKTREIPKETNNFIEDAWLALDGDTWTLERFFLELTEKKQDDLYNLKDISKRNIFFV